MNFNIAVVTGDRARRFVAVRQIKAGKAEMAMLSGNRQLMKWEPESIRCYMIRVAGQLLTGSGQLTIGSTPVQNRMGCLAGGWRLLVIAEIFYTKIRHSAGVEEFVTP